MKLKYTFELDTYARDDTSSLDNLVRHIDECDVEFLFGNKHRLIAINVVVPNVKVTYNSAGKIKPLDKSARGSGNLAFEM